MVRARLTQVNGEQFERDPETQSFTTRESQRERFFRNRGFKSKLYDVWKPDHDIVKGRDFSGEYDWDSDNPIEVSIEKRFASRLGLDVGDKLTLDIQGLEIEATLINTRQVNWLTFRPNFFVEMQPGSISDAPKTFIGVLTKLNNEQKNDLQLKIAQNFPSISMVDITRTIKEILKLIQQIQLILTGVALISILVGLFVIYSIGQFEGFKYAKDYNLLKVLGCVRSDIYGIFARQFFFILFPIAYFRNWT